MTQLTAQVILRLPDGLSPLSADLLQEGQVPLKKTIETALVQLKTVGFLIGARGSISITITGKKDVFEHFFEIKLKHLPSGTGEKSHDLLVRPFKVPDKLKAWLADLVFPISPQFFP